MQLTTCLGFACQHYVYFEEAAHFLTRDEARRIAANARRETRN
jgi:hypothetical protein